MRNNSIKSVSYAPGDPPVDPEQLQRFLRVELSALAAAINALAAGHMDPQAGPPAKPRDGDWRYANGTNWDPGGGAGFYRFDGAVWNKLG